MIDLTRSCNRHRPLLVDFIDRGEVRPATAAALAHLDRCDRCTEAIELTMLTITALRRLGDDAAAAAAAEPGVDAWPRLRARIQGWRRRPVVMSPLTGIAMSFALVAILVLPVRLGGTLIGPVASPRPDRSVVGTFADVQIEAAYIASARQAGVSSDTGVASTAATAGNYPRIYPDSRFVRKEVISEQPVRRAPEAI